MKTKHLIIPLPFGNWTTEQWQVPLAFKPFDAATESGPLNLARLCATAPVAARAARKRQPSFDHAGHPAVRRLDRKPILLRAAATAGTQ
jgi:hypothetical protein